MSKLQVYSQAMFTQFHVMALNIGSYFRRVRYTLGKGKLWLSAAEKADFYVSEVRANELASTVRIMYSLRPVQDLFGCEVPDFVKDLYGPLFQNRISEYTPLRLRQLNRILNTDQSDIQMFIRIYTEEALPLHRRLYLRNSGVWDVIIAKLLESKRSRLAA